MGLYLGALGSAQLALFPSSFQPLRLHLLQPALHRTGPTLSSPGLGSEIQDPG